MIPESLQALKNNARRVHEETTSVAIEDADKLWSLLAAEAEKNLGPLWEFVISKERPHHFRADTHQHEFVILLPDHRKMYAQFVGRSTTSSYGAPPAWWRTYYHGMATDATCPAWWMVDVKPGKSLPSYHHTLGSAMLAAEII